MTNLPMVAGLADMVVRPSALLLLATGGICLMSRASAAVRHLVWTTALAGAVLLPVLSPLLPDLRVPLPMNIGSNAASTSMLSVRPNVGVSNPLEGVVASSAAAEDQLIRPSSMVVGGAGWMELAFLIWLAGTLFVAGRLGLSVLGVWRIARRATMVTDGAWLHLAHDLARRIGLNRGVTLMRGAGGRIPMTWGVFQPVIWLPSEADGWTQERRAVVLAHELAHVRRRDALTQWIGHLAIAVYWFNPLVWMAASRLHEERERACDDAVLRMGTAPVRYADHLLQVVRMIGAPRVPGAAMAMARPSHFEGRVRAILDRSIPRDSISPPGVLAISFLALGCILSVAAVRAEASPGSVSEASPTRSADPSREIPLLTPTPAGSEGESTQSRLFPPQPVSRGPERDEAEATDVRVSTDASETTPAQGPPTEVLHTVASMRSSDESAPPAGRAASGGASASSSASSSANSSATQESERRGDGS